MGHIRIVFPLRVFVVSRIMDVLDSSMISCPDCDKTLMAGAKRCSCGWTEGKEFAIDLCCPFNDHGHICGERGSMSDCTNGAGPWYCSGHYWRLKGIVVTQRTQQTQPSYRLDWYAANKLPYENPKLTGSGYLRHIGSNPPDLRVTRQVGEDREEV